MDYRRQEIVNIQIDFSAWIFHHKLYIKWINGDCPLLWIKGKPGSGKSTLTKNIFKSIDENESQNVILTYFFHRRGNFLQQSLLGMFRTMSHQLLIQIPHVGAKFSEFWRKKTKWGTDLEKNWDWQLEELREAFSDALFIAARNHTIVVFVDALDEAGESWAQQTIRYFERLNKQLIILKAKTRICFSCRHYPIFPIKDALEICVEDENQEDIAKYVREELQESLLIDNMNDIEDLTKHITYLSSGVFLWVSLIIPIIARLYNDGEPLSAIHQILTKAPTGLHEIYRHILTTELDANNRARRFRLMQWIYFALRPLSVTEIRYAMASDDSSISPISFRESKDFVESDERMRKQILSLSGGLAEVFEEPDYSPIIHRDSKMVVQFIHQSVNDFLAQDGFMILDKSAGNDFAGKSHQLLFTSCLNYLKHDDLSHQLRLLAQPELKLKPYSDEESYERWNKAVDEKEFPQRFPLLEYTITCLFQHAAKAEEFSDLSTDFLQRFQWPDQTVM